jgi:hypothetical protein
LVANVSLTVRRRTKTEPKLGLGMNPLVESELARLALGPSEVAKVAKLRDELKSTLVLTSLTASKLIGALLRIEGRYRDRVKYGLESTLYYHLGRLSNTSVTLRSWLAGELSHGVDIVLKPEENAVWVSYRYRITIPGRGETEVEIAGNTFSTGTGLQRIIDWFINNRDVFENLARIVELSAGVPWWVQLFSDWLEKNGIPKDDPDVKEAFELFDELRRYVHKSADLIGELRELLGWVEKG